MYNFDEIINRKGTSSTKWDLADKGGQIPDLLPMWIADMDFRIAPAIARQMCRQVELSAFGYGVMPQEGYDAVIGWMASRHHYDVRPEWICYTPGVVAALFFAVDAVSQPGEDIMLCPPVYGPFFRAVEQQGRNAIKVPLLRDGAGYYTFDFDGMEAAVTPKTRALMLCSPHNPVGRVWTRQELERIADFALRHDLVVIDDEIHHDLVFGGREHIMLGRISEAIAQRAILCTAPSKTFNIAGLHISNIIIPNEQLRRSFQACVQKHHSAGVHSFCARGGRYTSLTRWEKDANGDLTGSIELPTPVGLVGGATKIHPGAQACVKILGVTTAAELAQVIAAVGLAQNFAALRALATDGIQKGHMKLHARNLATVAGATADQLDAVVAKMVTDKKISVDYAKEILAGM